MPAVKMNLHQVGWMGFAVLALVSTTVPVSAQQTTRSRGTPIIFSAPKSDTVSSNLNELRTPAAPFRDLEADLKKPFEIFDPNRSDKMLRPVDQRFKPPTPELNKKQLKEQLHEQAEQMFLSLEPQDDDLFKDAEESFDPYKKKPRTSLDRYYDRLDRNDRNRAAITNRTSVNDLFGDKKDKDGRNDFGFDKKRSGSLLDDERSVTSRNVRLMSNSSLSGDSVFSEQNNGRRTGDFFDGKQVSFYERNKTRSETRLEEFKQLLEGPSYSTRGKSKPSVLTTETPTRPVYGAAAPTWSSTKSTAKTPPANTFATSAGLVGTPAAPQGLNDFTSSSSLSTLPPTPPPAKPVKPPTFNIPKRRF